MPESPASSHLPEGKRGGGENRRGGGSGTASTAGRGLSNSGSSSSLTSESGARDRDRGGGGRRRDDLTGPMQYSTPEVVSLPSCDGGRSSSTSGAPFAPGNISSSSGGYIQEPQGSGAASPFPSSGMDASRLQKQLIEYTESLFLEGLLDDQFTQLQLLQDASNPEFVSEVVSLFFDDSEKLLEQLSDCLDGDPVDFKKVDAHVHQFKGSSSSIGAQRVKNACVTFRTYCEDENAEGCRQTLVLVKQEFFLVKSKLETMLALEQQLLAAGGSLPFVE